MLKMRPNLRSFMPITDKINQVVAEFAKFNQWEDKYRLLIKFGKELQQMEDIDKHEKFRIRGCQSLVWLKPVYQNGILNFVADSDAVLVKGIVALLLRVYNGHGPETIKETGADFLKEIGITEHLTMNRSNGLASMVKQIQLYAQAFDSLKQKGVMSADI
jgi:cysteine desulfuration protein SufE